MHESLPGCAQAFYHGVQDVSHSPKAPRGRSRISHIRPALHCGTLSHTLSPKVAPLSLTATPGAITSPACVLLIVSGCISAQLCLCSSCSCYGVIHPSIHPFPSREQAGGPSRWDRRATLHIRIHLRNYFSFAASITFQSTGGKPICLRVAAQRLHAPAYS